MTAIEWTASAFATLEALPETLAFAIVERVDLLEAFPALGVSLASEFPQLQNCRQLIIKRTHRVIYTYEAATFTVYILAIQHCKQLLPEGSELQRARYKK